MDKYFKNPNCSIKMSKSKQILSLLFEFNCFIQTLCSIFKLFPRNSSLVSFIKKICELIHNYINEFFRLRIIFRINYFTDFVSNFLTVTNFQFFFVESILVSKSHDKLNWYFATISILIFFKKYVYYSSFDFFFRNWSCTIHPVPLWIYN